MVHGILFIPCIVLDKKSVFLCSIISRNEYKKMEMIEEAKKMVEAGKRQEAILFLEGGIKENENNEEYLLYLGELIYAEGRMTDALNKFNAVLRLNPENHKATNYKTMINGILGYYCKDLLNP